MGRMVLVKWVPELHFIPLQYVVEIDVKPFGSNFAIDEQRFAYGAVEQALLEGLTPNSEMRMRIKAINSFGASPASNIISVTTKRISLIFVFFFFFWSFFVFFFFGF